MSGMHTYSKDAASRTKMRTSFDVVELSSGFLSFPPDDWLRLVERVHSYGMKAKPELGIQFGAGGDTEASALEQAGTSDRPRS
jgi:phosphosulfolactate synthase (CoM biosynthesis protein A)